MSPREKNSDQERLQPNAKERAIDAIRSLGIEKPTPPEHDADELERQAMNAGRKTERDADGGVSIFSEHGHRYYDREGHLIAASTQTWEARRTAKGGCEECGGSFADDGSCLECGLGSDGS